MEAWDATVAPAAFLGAVGALAACVILALGFRRSSAATDPAVSARVPRSGISEKHLMTAGTAGVIPGSAGFEAGVAWIDAMPADPVDARELNRPGSGDAPGQALAPEPRRSSREELACDTAAGSKPPGPGGVADGRLEPRVAPEGEQYLTGCESRPGREATEEAGRTAVGDAVTISSGRKGRGEGLIEPARLNEAREGGSEDLKLNKGIGQKFKVMLYRLGIFHYDQIAGWSDKEAARVEEKLQGAWGRVCRDGWVEQTRRLASEKRNMGSERGGGAGQGVIKRCMVTHE